MFDCQRYYRYLKDDNKFVGEIAYHYDPEYDGYVANVIVFSRYRGKGYGKIVAAAMVKETLRRGKIPVWGCDTRNEASMRLALSVGFETVGTHPWYKY